MGRGGQDRDDVKPADDFTETGLEDDDGDGGADTFDNPVAREHADAPNQDVAPPGAAATKTVATADDQHAKTANFPSSPPPR